MRYLFIFVFLFLFFPNSSILAEENNEQLAEKLTTIRINEVLPNPKGKDTGNEFVEIYNYGKKDINLENWKVCNSKNKCKSFKKDSVIKKNSFALLFGLSLKNSGTEIFLKHDDKKIDSFKYTKSSEGISWNYDSKKWYEAKPSPNKTNNTNPADINYPKILLNEVYPRPSDKKVQDEFIEIYNPTDKDISLENWVLKDASKTGKYIFQKNDKIKAKSYFVVEKKEYKFALNDKGDEFVRLFSPNDKLSDEISYKNAKKGASFAKFGDKWKWTTILTPKSKNELPPNKPKNYPKLLLSEIYPYPGNKKAQDEFIEIYNPTDKDISLENWILKDGSKTGKYVFQKNDKIKAKSYFVVKKGEFKFGLNNSTEETVYLYKPDNNLSDSFAYKKASKNFSFALELKTTKWKKTSELTPGRKNKFSIKNNYPKLIISELLPNPSTDEKENEFIEIYNPNNFNVSLKSWKLRDSSKSGEFVFEDEKILKPFGYVAIYRKKFKFALNNSGKEVVYLISPNNKEKSKVSYDYTKKDVSYAWDGKKWRFTKILTPGKENKFTKPLLLKKLKVEKNIYKNVKAKFEASSNYKGKNVKYKWDFGDGRKSYKRKTTHTYKKSGRFVAYLTISSDIEKIVKKFEVNVKKYPKYNVNIVEISPNPKGKDTGNEYIIIKNKSKKTINFKNWSIATGKDKKHLVNHPILKKFKLKHGEKKKIYTKYSKISLPNKGGVVELRAPNGKVVYRRKYFLEGKSNIPEGSKYLKIDKSWVWQIPKEDKKKKKTSKHNKKELSSKVAQDIVSNALDNDKKSNIVLEEIQKSNPKIEFKKETFFEKLFDYVNSFLSKLYNKKNNFSAKSIYKYDIIDIDTNYDKNYIKKYSINFFN